MKVLPTRVQVNPYPNPTIYMIRTARVCMSYRSKLFLGYFIFKVVYFFQVNLFSHHLGV